MKKSKSLKRLIAAIIGIFLFANFLMYMIIGNTFKWKYKVENFEYYIEDFNSINNIISNYVLQNDGLSADNHYLFCIGYDSSEKNYTLLLDERKCYISKEIQPMLNKICTSAFDRNLDSHLEWVWYSDGMISYEIGNGKYALVYSNEKDVIYEKYSLQSKDVSIKKCYNNWYHVSIDKGN